MRASDQAQQRQGRPGLSPNAKRGIWIAIAAIVLLGIVLGTKVVSDDDPLAAGDVKFNADTFGADNFPQVRDFVVDHAVDATDLAAAIAADPDKAADDFGQLASGKAVYSVKFAGVVGDGASGIYDVAVDGVPDGLRIRVQTGPAINGTDLRDVTGTMPFGDFSNQIDYQNAASGLNEEMKKQVLADVDTTDLTGKTVSVVGAFTLVNPDSWLVVPVQLEIQ